MAGGLLPSRQARRHPGVREAGPGRRGGTGSLRPGPGCGPGPVPVGVMCGGGAHGRTGRRPPAGSRDGFGESGPHAPSRTHGAPGAPCPAGLRWAAGPGSLGAGGLGTRGSPERAHKGRGCGWRWACWVGSGLAGQLQLESRGAPLPRNGVCVHLRGWGAVWGVVTRCQGGLGTLGLRVPPLPAAGSPGRGATSRGLPRGVELPAGRLSRQGDASPRPWAHEGLRGQVRGREGQGGGCACSSRHSPRPHGPSAAGSQQASRCGAQGQARPQHRTGVTERDRTGGGPVGRPQPLDPSSTGAVQEAPGRTPSRTTRCPGPSLRRRPPSSSSLHLSDQTLGSTSGHPWGPSWSPTLALHGAPPMVRAPHVLGGGGQRPLFLPSASPRAPHQLRATALTCLAVCPPLPAAGHQGFGAQGLS